VTRFYERCPRLGAGLQAEIRDRYRALAAQGSADDSQADDTQARDARAGAPWADALPEDSAAEPRGLRRALGGESVSRFLQRTAQKLVTDAEREAFAALRAEIVELARRRLRSRVMLHEEVFDTLRPCFQRGGEAPARTSFLLPRAEALRGVAEGEASILCKADIFARFEYYAVDLGYEKAREALESYF